jgi:hypothetical protein
VYPFDEYHELTFSGGRNDEVFFGDWFMRTAINTGLQINTVVSTANLDRTIKNGSLEGCVIVAPAVVAENERIFETLTAYMDNGGKVLFYGPLKAGKLLSLSGSGRPFPSTGSLA